MTVLYFWKINKLGIHIKKYMGEDAPFENQILDFYDSLLLCIFIRSSVMVSIRFLLISVEIKWNRVW